MALLMKRLRHPEDFRADLLFGEETRPSRVTAYPAAMKSHFDGGCTRISCFVAGRVSVVSSCASRVPDLFIRGNPAPTRNTASLEKRDE